MRDEFLYIPPWPLHFEGIQALFPTVSRQLHSRAKGGLNTLILRKELV